MHSVKEQILIIHSVKEQFLIMHSVKEQSLFVHSVKEQIFNHAQFQGADFSAAQCQGAHFYLAQCQGVDFSDAQCQGAYFFNVQCQGAYAGDEYIEFKDRIGKETELKTMQFVGELTKEAIENIEAAKNHLDDAWYQKMQKIIDENIKRLIDTIPETKVKRLMKTPYPKELRRVS